MLQCNEEVIVNQKAYKLIKLLGHGKGGYSYLAENNKSLVVLKQIHHEPCSYYTFGNKIEAEINDYRRLCDAGINIPKMIDVDEKSERIIKEYIEGDLISELVKQDKVFNRLDIGLEHADLHTYCGYFAHHRHIAGGERVFRP